MSAFDQALGQVRPVLSIIGSVIIVLGLLKFFGFNINVLQGTGLEIAVAGFLMKSI